MAKNATREMTSGSPVKLILSFAVPLLLGMLFQQFYSMVDTIIVGKVWALISWPVSDPQAQSTL